MLKLKRCLVKLFPSLPLLISINLFSPTSFAQPVFYYPHSLFHVYGTLGGGIAMATNLGRSQTFPDPVIGNDSYINSGNGIHSIGAFDGSFGVELAFHPLWKLQLGLGYNQTGHMITNGTWIQSVNTAVAESFSYRYRVIASQYQGETKLLFNYCRFHPYVMLGAGISQNEAYGYLTSSPSVSFANHTTSSFSYSGGIGFDVDVLPYLRLGLGYRFINFGKVKLGHQIINAKPYPNTLSQSNLYVHEGLIQFTFVL